MNKTSRIIFIIVGVAAILAFFGFVFGRFAWNPSGFWGEGMMHGTGPGMMGRGFTTGWGQLWLVGHD